MKRPLSILVKVAISGSVFFLFLVYLVLNMDSKTKVLSDLVMAGGHWKNSNEGIEVDVSGLFNSKFRIQRLRRVRLARLDISSSQYSFGDLEHIGFQPTLWFVAARRLGSTKGLATLTRNAPNLISAELCNSGIDDEAIFVLAKLSKLERLNLSGTKITDDACELLKGMQSLRQLDLSNTAISDRTVNTLCRSDSKIEILNLASTKISSSSTRHIPRLKHLKHLNLANTNVTGDSLADLSKLKLKSLDLSLCDVSDNDVANLTSMNGLITLGLDKTNVTPACLKALRQMESLLEVFAFGIEFSPFDNIDGERK